MCGQTSFGAGPGAALLFLHCPIVSAAASSVEVSNYDIDSSMTIDIHKNKYHKNK